MKTAQKRTANRRREPTLSDVALLDLVQRQTFRYFWDGAHPACGLARDRRGLALDPDDDLVHDRGSRLCGHGDHCRG